MLRRWRRTRRCKYVGTDDACWSFWSWEDLALSQIGRTPLVSALGYTFLAVNSRPTAVSCIDSFCFSKCGFHDYPLESAIDLHVVQFGSINCWSGGSGLRRRTISVASAKTDRICMWHVGDSCQVGNEECEVRMCSMVSIAHNALLFSSGLRIIVSTMPAANLSRSPLFDSERGCLCFAREDLYEGLNCDIQFESLQIWRILCRGRHVDSVTDEWSAVSDVDEGRGADGLSWDASFSRVSG